MSPQENYSLLRTILRTLGLSAEAIDDIVSRIMDLLSPHDEKVAQTEFPYFVRDDFLSPAEHSFYLVLRSAVLNWAIICPKVALGDLFRAKSNDPSLYRTYTNRIDRKHVDFLLCDTQTMRPMVGIELDDSSHQRPDRQARDEFVQCVFSAAHLPLVRLPVRRAYAVAELGELLREQLYSGDTRSSPVSTAAKLPESPVTTNPWSLSESAAIPSSASTTEPASFTPLDQAAPPSCPQCGTAMVLRTASKGPNQGGRFWGCPNYPRCRAIVKYEPAG